MRMRLIDADALKSKMDGYWGRCQRIRKPRNGETAVFLDIKAAVEAQPTVDAEPVRHGKWCEGTECYSDDFIVCSVCGEAFNVLDNDTYRFDYCPKCGARMDGDEKTD